MKVRIGTFNIENLFTRYRFRRNFAPLEADGSTINNLTLDVYDKVAKQITAKAIHKIDTDALAVRKPENLRVLDRFNTRYLVGNIVTRRRDVKQRKRERGWR